VNAGYLAGTCADSLLAPVFPVVAVDLGIGLESAGFAFALLAASVAVGNVAGGFVLTHAGPRTGAGVGLVIAAAGALIAAGAGSTGPFLAAQTLMGGGSGIFFASGLSAAATLAGERRRGLAMGFFGIAFSGGLATAAVLAALGSVHGWRVAFAGSAGVSVVALLAVLVVAMPSRPERIRGAGADWRRALGAPLAVGGTAAASQYGTISFLPTFAVVTWGISPVAAALMLAAARVLSVPSKLVAGHGSDRLGARATAGAIGLVLAIAGIAWTLAPAFAIGLVPAVVFAAAVSGLGPVANVLALEAFGQRGTMLGLFRSMQIALGAGLSALIGVCASWFGLRPTLAVAAALPLGLALLARRAGRAATAVARDGQDAVAG